jgi:transcriptional regulator with XRE-family HTH domain
MFKQIRLVGKEPVGEYIRRLREERNLPQRKSFSQLDVDTSTLIEVEHGERKSIDHLLSQTLKPPNPEN